MINVSVDELLENYSPSSTAIEIVRGTKIVLLVGITDAGKVTIKRKLLAKDRYHSFVSYTTRQPRMSGSEMEVDGVDYHFVSLETMIDLLETGEMIEAKRYSGNIYGSTIHDLQLAQASNKVAINDVEVQGVAEYKKISPAVKAIFILPPDFQEWHRRLIARYNNEIIDPVDLAMRIKTAAQELKAALESKDFYFVVNDSVDRAVAQVENIITDSVDPAEAQRGQEIAKKFLQSFSAERNVSYL